MDKEKQASYLILISFMIISVFIMIVNSYEIGKKQINTPHDLGEQYPVMKALMI